MSWDMFTHSWAGMAVAYYMDCICPGGYAMELMPSWRWRMWSTFGRTPPVPDVDSGTD